MQAKFIADVLKNRNNAHIMERWDALNLIDGWLVAGCLFQTVWNVLSGHPPDSKIKDYDFFYFDPSDLSEAAESAVQHHVEMVLEDLGITVEVANQARVHCWYEEHFGYPYAPLSSAKEGISRFLIPGTCVGINACEVYAPNGLHLMYEGTLTMNPLTPHEALFIEKAASYQQRWPWLNITHVPAQHRPTHSTQTYEKREPIQSKQLG
ncbi:MAG: nucleotidyltransferase family protein [Gammaproteobacteria bacterium]|nr:nucleotidyltransferase family protein [Gammaproteobacteria bacterium]MBU2067962.1 nucleotidyltransferase family protein [Gammaproteobacteria bacterium]MBU2139646.1 nucleotidyltransferase family protein [Gammaproteobacteria bacterium]MBU2215224.1 nucleotidyltransferase family protein [Gammaproteobacteria bacterium]MBU2323317.1 nucleotidyltransferase family protein [Gammaproteobacteria bacterium]